MGEARWRWLELLRIHNTVIRNMRIRNKNNTFNSFKKDNHSQKMPKMPFFSTYYLYQFFFLEAKYLDRVTYAFGRCCYDMIFFLFLYRDFLLIFLFLLYLFLNTFWIAFFCFLCLYI